MKCEDGMIAMYKSKSIDVNILLKWSKLLDYGFFRIYTTSHPFCSSRIGYKQNPQKNTELPQFRKNIYTIEIIEFVLEMIKNESKR